jgi:hypothetical protein
MLIAMTYRNDHDALFARLEATERENRELRAELAARDQPPEVPEPTTFDRWSERLRLTADFTADAFTAFVRFVFRRL